MKRPQRIVSLLSSATEMLYLLGLGDAVVGVSHECDYPSETALKPRVTRSNINSLATSVAIDDEVKSRLSDGLPLYEIDLEQMILLKPDLIVTQSQCDVCAVRYEDVVQAVHGNSQLVDVPILGLNPHSLDEVLQDIGKVAEAAGVTERGRQVVENLRKRLAEVGRCISAVPKTARPRVACIEWTDPLMLAANWMPELVSLAGGEHALTLPGVHSGYSAWEDLLAYNPEVVVVMPCGFSLDRSVTEAELLATRPRWDELAAVRAGRLFAVDANAYFNRPGPRLVESVELLAHLLHPTFVAAPADLAEMAQRV